MASLQERLLELLGRAPATYDALRGSLGVQSAELDEAIRVLERSKQITRDRGRFHLVGSELPKSEAAQASSEEQTMAKKTCNQCGKEKPTADFPKTGAQCKACLAEKAAARYHAQKSPAAAGRVNGKGSRYDAVLTELRAKRKAIDDAIAAIEALSA